MRTKGHRLGAFAAAVVAVLPVVAAAQPAPSERCGPYAVVLVSGVVPKGGGSLALVDRQDRRVHEIRGAAVHVESCEDVTGDRRPDLVVSSYSGGQNCCTTFHVLDLGTPVRTLLRWEAGHEAQLESTNFADATRARELTGRDDRLGGFGGLPAAFSPTLPVVFCYERGAFADCTRQVTEPVEVEFQEAKDELRVEKDLARRQAGGLSVLALSLLLDEEPAAWTWLGELAADVVPWLKQRRAALGACLGGPVLAPRDERLTRCASPAPRAASSWPPDFALDVTYRHPADTKRYSATFEVRGGQAHGRMRRTDGGVSDVERWTSRMSEEFTGTFQDGRLLGSTAVDGSLNSEIRVDDAWHPTQEDWSCSGSFDMTLLGDARLRFDERGDCSHHESGFQGQRTYTTRYPDGTPRAGRPYEGAWTMTPLRP